MTFRIASRDHHPAFNSVALRGIAELQHTGQPQDGINTLTTYPRAVSTNRVGMTMITTMTMIEGGLRSTGRMRMAQIGFGWQRAQRASVGYVIGSANSVVKSSLGTSRNTLFMHPAFTLSEDSRWDYRVIIVRSSQDASPGQSESEVAKQLFSDQGAFTRDENRRWELTTNHWDLPIHLVKLDGSE
jgi:hypothetical protein